MNRPESDGERLDRELRELLTRREGWWREVRRAIAGGEDIGIMQHDEPCATQWVGTQAALVAEGLCTPDQFPDERKRFKSGEADGRDWQTTRLARGHVAFLVRLTAEEQDRRSAKEFAAKCKAKAHGPDGEYGSVEAYTEMAELVVQLMKRRLLGVLSGTDERALFGSITLVYDRETIQRIESLCEQVQQTIQSGSASWTRGEREAQRDAKAARADLAFASFLKQALGDRAQH
jgi:hypothetical protein